MNFTYKHILPVHYSPNARVWVYQSSRLFAMSEALQIEEVLEHFVANWKSHGAVVTGFATLLFGQFIVLVADETSTTVSGCSTDSSVHLIQEIEKGFKVSLMDRQQLGFVVKEKVQVIPLYQLDYALQNNFITEHSLYFNNTITTLQELQSNWLIPIANSWLKSKLPSHTTIN